MLVRGKPFVHSVRALEYPSMLRPRNQQEGVEEIRPSLPRRVGRLALVGPFQLTLSVVGISQVRPQFQPTSFCLIHACKCGHLHSQAILLYGINAEFTVDCQPHDEVIVLPLK